jgi:DNA-binding transcriptional ArsR family regulator
MPDAPDIAPIAALVGDPTRGKMLAALMDGRARTASELALEGGVMPSTASSHLARLCAAGLVAIAKEGRHRYFRIAEPDVAAAIEALTNIAARTMPPRVRLGPCDEGLRRARVCYDHLAGEAAVRILERMRERNFIAGADQAMGLTGRGVEWCGRIGIDLEALRTRRRPLCRACLDWSERRTHLAGSLGAALLDRMSKLRYARREADSRVVILSQRGESFVAKLELSSAERAH